MAEIPNIGIPTASGLIPYGSSPDEKAKFYYPPGVASFVGQPVIVCVHGGGFIKGSETEFNKVAPRLAQQGFVAADINYTWASAAVAGYPMQPDQVQTAVDYLRANNAQSVGVLGSSAGGTLAYFADADAIVGWSGPTDMIACQESTNPKMNHTGISDFVGATDPVADVAQYKLASPLYHVSAGRPPTQVWNSEDEVIPLPTAYIEALADTGVTYEEHFLPGDRHAIAYATTALADTVAWFKRFLV